MKIRISQLEKERESITISNTNNHSLNASQLTKENHHFSESSHKSHKLNSSNNKLLSSSIMTESINCKEQTNLPSNINPNMSINLSSSQTKSSINKHQIAINSDGHTPQENNDMALERNRSRMITMLNRNCVDDLDSIYFFDKINMRANSASHNNIPKLNLNFLQMKPKKKEEGNTVINVNQSQISQSLVNNGSTMNIKKHAGVKFNYK